MIKGIILDVDGVIVGGKNGYNWPEPHPEIIHALKTIRSSGIFVSLCTGKGTFAIKKIVESAHLDNLHIGDGGAIVVDVLNSQVIAKHTVDSNTVVEMVRTFQNKNTYLELYTQDGYYIQKNSVGDITDKHQAILYKEPTIVDSLIDLVNHLDVVKIMPIARDEEDKQRVIQLFQKINSGLSLQWGVHPTALPYQFGIITAKGISKRQAANVISAATGVTFKNMLGVGDSLTDWEFIELCSYGGVMGNASEDLKLKVKTKSVGNYFIGSSVDENGLLDIFKFFGLI
jgi:Cof subfamily protein (haloacid dehalogenase superfamily)